MTQRLGLAELLQRLVDADVRFVVVGGLAVNAWGYVRATQDLDLVPAPDPDNLERLASVLEAVGGVVETREGRLGPAAIRTFLKVGERTLVATDLGPVDVLQGLPQVPRYAQLQPDSQAVEMGNVRVQVCSLAALLDMKRASERPRDRDDLETLEAAHGDD